MLPEYPPLVGPGIAGSRCLEGRDSTVRTVSTVSRWHKCLRVSDLGADGSADGRASPPPTVSRPAATVRRGRAAHDPGPPGRPGPRGSGAASGPRRLGAAGPTGEDRGDPDRSLPIDSRRALDARPPSAMPSRADRSGSPPRSPGGPSPRPAPVPAGMGAGAGRGRPASPATDRRGAGPISLDISHPEWDRPGRPGTRRGPAPARGPSAGGPRPTPHGRGRPAAAEGGGWRGSVAACGRGGPAARPRRRPPRRRPGPPRRSRRAGTRAGPPRGPGAGSGSGRARRPGRRSARPAPGRPRGRRSPWS